MHHFSLIAANIFLGTIFLGSCSNIILKYKDKTQELSEKAIFEYLQKPSIVLDQLESTGRIKIDPILCLRETLSMNGKVYFNESMHSERLKYPLIPKTYQLEIPDSLFWKYQYPNHDDKDYEHDYSTIHQFSQLLTTKEPNIYLMEHIFWGNICTETGCLRTLSRCYLQFKIESRKITILETIPLEHLPDFIVFGSFAKERLNKALPGEKIKKYGH